MAASPSSRNTSERDNLQPLSLNIRLRFFALKTSQTGPTQTGSAIRPYRRYIVDALPIPTPSQGATGGPCGGFSPRGTGMGRNRRCNHDVSPIWPDSRPRLSRPRFGSLDCQKQDMNSSIAGTQINSSATVPPTSSSDRFGCYRPSVTFFTMYCSKSERASPWDGQIADGGCSLFPLPSWLRGSLEY